MCTRRDGNGHRLRYVYASQLQEGIAIPESANYRAKAIKAYIDALPGDAPVVIFRH